MGLLDGASPPSNTFSEDVADEWFAADGSPRRLRVWDDDDAKANATSGLRLVREIDLQPETDDADDNADSAPVGRRIWRWFEAPLHADGESSAAARAPVLLEVHTGDVQTFTELFTRKLGLNRDLAEAVCLAARLHDLGKRRRNWQRSIGNFDPDPSRCLAKSGRGVRVRDFGDGYRHEFGSLLDALKNPELNNLPPERRDVVLHLIASHHGRGRPHFPIEEAFDTEAEFNASEELASEVPLRFARLQYRFGRWGLAYLESLLRAADYAASAQPSSTLEVRP